MANTREIKERISSIKDTRKITNAMYMISTNKLRKAKAALEKTEPYFYTMQSAMAYIMKHFPEIKHPFFDSRPKLDLTQRKTGFIVESHLLSTQTGQFHILPGNLKLLPATGKFQIKLTHLQDKLRRKVLPVILCLLYLITKSLHLS